VAKGSKKRYRTLPIYPSALSGHMTGMRGVFLVAAQLARLGFIVSPTARNAAGADLLVSNQRCSKAFTVQVKANAKCGNNWLVGKHAKRLSAHTLIYVLVNNCSTDAADLYVVPSNVIARQVQRIRRPKSIWYAVYRDSIARYRDRWALFGKA
jgi:hypothetical protein